MSINWVQDIAEMHKQFGVNEVVSKFDDDKLKKFLEFRIGCLQEELDELKEAKSGDTILFSPACKSFDMFANYEHRGLVFKKAVMSL